MKMKKQLDYQLNIVLKNSIQTLVLLKRISTNNCETLESRLLITRVIFRAIDTVMGSWNRYAQTKIHFSKCFICRATEVDDTETIAELKYDLSICRNYTNKLIGEIAELKVENAELYHRLTRKN